MDPIVPQNIRIKRKIDEDNQDNQDNIIKKNKNEDNDLETELDDIFIIAKLLYSNRKFETSQKYIEKIINNNNYLYHYVYILILYELNKYDIIVKYLDDIYKLIENITENDFKIYDIATLITNCHMFGRCSNIEDFKNILWIIHIESIIKLKLIDQLDTIYNLFCKISQKFARKSYIIKMIEDFCKDNNLNDFIIKIYEKENLYKQAAFYYSDKKLYEKANFYLKKIIENFSNSVYQRTDILYFIGSIKEFTFDDSIYKIEKFYDFSDSISGYDLTKKIYKSVNDIQKLDIIYILTKYTKYTKYRTYTYENTDSKNYISAISIYENLNDSNKSIVQEKFNKIMEKFNENIKNTGNITNYIQYYSYFNKENKDLYLKKFIEYINLDLIFKDSKNIIKETECKICLDKSIIISLNCHHTHELCYKCYDKMNKCPYCRNPYKQIDIYDDN